MVIGRVLSTAGSCLIRNNADPLTEENISFNGWYVQAGYFLTGENRVYDRKSGKYKRPVPKSMVGDGGSPGVTYAYDGADYVYTATATPGAAAAATVRSQRCGRAICSRLATCAAFTRRPTRTNAEDMARPSIFKGITI